MNAEFTPTSRRLHVVFGDPRYDCRYTGVCRVELDVWDIHCACTSALTHITLALPDQLNCLIPPAEITPAVLRQFTNGELRLPAPCPLTPAVAQHIGWPQRELPQIAAGSYPARQTEEGLSFTLRLVPVPTSPDRQEVARPQVQGNGTHGYAGVQGPDGDTP